jgi:hypothetical protein
MIPTQAFAKEAKAEEVSGTTESSQNVPKTTDFVVNEPQSDAVPAGATEEVSEQNEGTEAYKDLEIKDMPDELKAAALDGDTKALDESGTIDVVTDAELKSLNTVTDDNTKSIQIFDTPIKYVEDGEIQFIDSSLADSEEKISKSETFAYENKANSIKVYLPETTSDSIKISDGEGYSIEQQPMSETIATVNKKLFTFLSEELEVAEYKDVFGKGYDLQYSPQNDGVRENIVIQEDKGIYSFDFLLNTPGLVPKELTGNPFILSRRIVW